MSSTLLEHARQNLEACEKLEASVGTYLEETPSGQKGKVWQQHYVKETVNKVVNLSLDSLKIFSDEDSALKDEIAAMKGVEMFNSFYTSLNATREYYEKFPAVTVSTTLTETKVSLQFSGEEVFGKYFDLVPFHLKFNNLSKKHIGEQDYLQYLDRFSTFFYIAPVVKSTSQYNEYLDSLWQYLHAFFGKVNPLVSLTEVMHKWEADYNDKWQLTKKSDPSSGSGGAAGNKPEPLRLGMFNTPDELVSLGANRLKDALTALGLKCGGTVEERAARLWSVRGKKVEDFPANLLVKSSGKRKLGEGAEAAADNSSTTASTASYPWSNEVAWKEARIALICDLMSDTVSQTRRHAEKQQSRSAEEKESEIYEEEFGLSAYAAASLGKDGNPIVDHDGDDEPIYNPLNLPLGWDGKPIPFWLYKLHGLGVEYKCEVCGNFSYWGRRAFDRHFQEGKHAHGMRCLGVPNTKHFHDITLIEDVLALYAKIRDTMKVEQFVQEAEEEFEDTEGNILDRRTYEDLARQGLL